QGNIWVATEVGLNYYDFTNDSFQHYYHDPESDNSLSNNYITKLFFDDQKILWVGTLDNGLNKYDKGNRKFFISFPEINNSQNTDIKNVKSVYQDSKNRYWIGSDFGLFLYSPDFELLNIFRHDPKDKKTLDIGGITGICEDIYDQIWICTWGGGLHQLNQSNWEFSRIPRQGNDPFESRMYNDPFDIHNLGDADVRCMQPDNYGRIWVGTTLGFIDCYDINKKTFVHHFIYDKDSLRGVPVTSMELSRNGILWAGGLENGGLIKLDPKTMHIKRYFASEKKNSLLSNDVYSLCIDQHDNVWIGTDMGISMLNTSTDSFVNFSEKINLVNQTVYNIEIDHKENLWISTATKMIQYNIEQNSIIEYFVQDGIKKKVIAGITDNKGNIIVGGINGVNMIDEDQFTKNNAIPRIVFTDFRLFNEKIDFKNDSSVLKNHINCVDEIRLNYKQGFFSIGFAALNYSQTAKNRYKYRLEGIDYDWVDAGNSRYASYTNIAPGTYTFKVMGSNNDDIWNPDGRVLSIIIDPPWYKTWWSLTLLLMLLISIIFIIIKISLGRERLKSEIVLEKMNARRNKELLNKEREVDQLKQQFFTNISHEFRSPLTLILGPVGELLKKNSLETKDAQNLTIVHKNAGRLLRLVNQVMDFSKIDLGFMKFVVTEDNIALQIVTIVETFNNHAERKSIRYSYTTSHNRVVGYFDPDKIEKILYNLISNAFKFTPDNGIIEISVRYYKNGTLLSFDDIFADSIEIKVSDSGIGISEEDQEFIFKRFYQANKSKNGTGIGLSLAHSLAKIHGGDINVSSKEGCGATFTLELPLVLEKMDNFVLMEHLRIPPEIIEITPQGNRINKPIKERKREDEVIQKDHAKRIVLVVEDNLEIQEYIQSILIDFYHLEFADDGEKGFMKAVSIIPDLIISDLMMPVMDGYMLCDEIKARQETSHIPVILLTAKVNPDAKLIGLAHGAIDYMIKPFEPQELKLKVDNIIDTQYKLRDKISVHGNFSFKVTSHNSIDEKFLKDVFRIIEENLSDSEFDHHVLSKEIGMSRAQLYRKMKALTSKSVHEIIRDFRLEKSLEFLRDKGKNVSEVMYEVGFKNSSYFTKCFKEQYDISPSEYKKSII
ncbi:MAG: ATP-binding protein, partial [bacterium]